MELRLPEAGGGADLLADDREADEVVEHLPAGGFVPGGAGEVKTLLDRLEDQRSVPEPEVVVVRLGFRRRSDDRSGVAVVGRDVLHETLVRPLEEAFAIGRAAE